MQVPYLAGPRPDALGIIAGFWGVGKGFWGRVFWGIGGGLGGFSSFDKLRVKRAGVGVGFLGWGDC